MASAFSIRPVTIAVSKTPSLIRFVRTLLCKSAGIETPSPFRPDSPPSVLSLVAKLSNKDCPVPTPASPEDTEATDEVSAATAAIVLSLTVRIGAGAVTCD